MRMWALVDRFAPWRPALSRLGDAAALGLALTAAAATWDRVAAGRGYELPDEWLAANGPWFLLWFVLAFAVLIVIAFLLLSGPASLASGKGARATKSRPLELVVSAAVVVMAVVVIYQTILTGDAGARAVWSNILPK